MTEPGDKLERRYRDLARDEPPRSLDAAILEASRDAVRRRSPSRWAVPVSIAAVLVLAVGVTLRMQQEEPGIETSIPQGAPPPVAPAAPAQIPPRTASEPAQPAAPAPAPAPRAKTERKDERQREQKPKLAAPPVEKPAATQSAPLAFPAQENAAPAPAAPPAPAAAAQSAPAAAMPAPAAQTAPSADAMQAPAAGAAKRMAPMAVQPRSAAEERAAAQPGDELERIARLRAEGRDAEADRALEQFRRRFPGYRIDPAMWERVRPREAR